MNIRQRIAEYRKAIAPQTKELKFTLRRIKRSPLSIIGMIIVTSFVIIAVTAPILAPPVLSDPFRIWRDGYYSRPKPPGTPVTDPLPLSKGYTVHLWGTASGQYDIYYGCIWGTITAFRIGLTVTLVSLIIGLIIGLAAGYYGGVVDELTMRLTDIIFAFPGLVLAMALVITLPPRIDINMSFIIIAVAIFIVATLASSIFLKLPGSRSVLIGFVCSIVYMALDIYVLKIPTFWRYAVTLTKLDKSLFAITIVGWPGYTRLIRGEVLRIKTEDYIEASKAVGCSDFRILFGHILPNAVYPILITASLDIGGTVLLAAALSFLGLGADPGYADWGQMISFARNYVSINMEYWYTFFIPGFFIFMFVLGWNLLGDAFRDILDPTLRRR
jgi:peptide/nickel transport system permease protein